MIWRLTYCNKKGVEARIDIIKGGGTSVEIVEGSANPFTLSYKLDKNDKSGHIMTSSADIEIFETETFNIDDLKTSNETELKVEYFEDNVLTWSGFILPDFFSREIGSPNIVRMTASDRLTALKGITLSDLPAKVSLRDLIELSLAQTGLSLALVAQIQINQGSTNILDSEILSQRLTDTRGRSISCYDILMAIMVATNSTIRQREGQWVVYNKLEHELRTPTIFFDKVERGAIRTIQPVASSVGVYQEFGGNRLHPNNYDFSNGLTNWTEKNGFNGYIDNRVVAVFLGGTPVYQPDVTTKDYLVNINDWITDETNLDTAPFLESNNIPIASTQNNTVEVEVDISAVMAEKLSSTTAISFLRYAVIATNGIDTYALTPNGVFEAYDPEKINKHSITLAGGQQHPLILASPAYTNSSKRKGVLEVDNVNDFHINIRIYGSGLFQCVNVNFVSVRFGNKTETPKGNLYKTTQGSNFTKQHDIETVIFGDYIRKGLNGYFYNYPIDDTSNLYLPSGELSSPTWITLFDTTERPLLHHISRQKSRLFSVAHDILRANIDVESFDPLAVFQDCKGGKYVVVSARFDFLRSEADVELEQIAYDNTILKRDFIYSYFGDGEDSIKSIGGIAGGGGTGGGGGGMTSDQIAILADVEEKAHTHENKEILDKVTQEIIDNASRGFLTSTDEQTEPTDDNIMSSLRVILEILKNNEELKNLFLSKIDDDTASGLITFLKGLITAALEVGGESLFRGLARALEGIQFGESFIPGLTGLGGLIDGSGKAELDALSLRKWLEVPELRYNRVEVTIGDKWSAPGAGIIESVDTENKVIKLKLEEGEIGTFDVDDICMGIYHSLTSEDNATSNYDDSKGNRRFAGFATSYFRIIQVMDSQRSTLRYELRPISASHPNPVHPSQFMHAVAYGNFTNADRQTSSYQTRTYTRYLKGVRDWEFTLNNIAAQFGNLDNLNVFGLEMSGYSIYLNNVYFTGIIHQLSQQIQDELNKQQVGGKNLLREYDIRFGFKYWGGTGEFIEVNLDTLQNQPYLSVTPKNITWVFPDNYSEVNVKSNTNWVVE